MASSQLLYANLTTRQLSTTLGGSNYSFPTLIAGQGVPLALRFSQSSDGITAEVFPPIAALRCALGLIDQPPSSGRFKIKIGDGIASAANTTGFLNFNASAQSIETALNSLSAKPSTFTVMAADGSWFIWLENGALISLTLLHNQLLPISFGRVNAEQIDGSWRHELRLVQTPLAFTDTASPIVPPLPFITTVREGGSDESGVTLWSEIQRLDLPATFRGTFALGFGLVKTALLSQADTTSSIETALNTALTGQLSGGTQISVAVTNPDDGYFHLEFFPSGVNFSSLTVIPGDAPPGDWTLALPLTDAALYDALRVSSKLTGIPLEISADLWIDPTDHSHGTTPIILAQTTLTVQAPVRWPELATVPQIDWQRRPSPRDYIPYTPDQVLTGQQQAYPATIGNGVDVDFPIDHNLGCPLVAVMVREHGTGGRLVPPSEYTTHFSSDNSLTLSGFATTPTASQYDVLIFGIGPASVFQAHTHTIAQIVGLQILLDGYETAISTLQSILPTVPGAGVPQSGNGIVIPIQQISEIIGYRGVAPTPDPATGLKDSQLPGSHLLTPQSKFDRELWRVAVNPQMLALGRKLTADWGVALQLLKANCAAEYKMCVEIGTYADQFTAGHFIVGASYKILTVGTTNFTAIGASANTVGISFVATGVGSGTGTATTNATLASTNSLLNVVWNTGSPVFTQPLFLTNEQIIHSFGLVISRGIVSGVETFTLSQMLYGILSGNNGAAPASANFAIRARLIDLETESVSPAKGYISWGVVPSITPLSAGGTGCQAVIST